MSNSKSNINDSQDEDYGEDRTNPFMNIIRAVFSFIWLVITAPFKLIWHFLKMMNEVRVVILGLLTFIVLVIVGLVLIFVFKPAFAWEPLKGFLNNDIQTPVYLSLTEESIYQKINIGSAGEVILSESEITFLYRKVGLINENSVVGLTDNTIMVYFNADSKESPLWIYVKAVENQNGGLEIISSGFGRLSMPNFISNWLADGFNSTLDLLGKQNKNSSLVLLMNQILDSNKVSPYILLKSAKIQQQEIVLKFDNISVEK